MEQGSFDPQSLNLGKTPARHDPRTIRYEDLTTSATELETAPPASHWGHRLMPGTMLGNDRWGDCVEAEFGHQVVLWERWAGSGDAQVYDSDVLAAYAAIAGFKEGDPSTDRGTNMLDAQNYWRRHGLAGARIDAFASVDPQSSFEVQEAVAWYGGVSIGLLLPVSAQGQTGADGLWDVTSGPQATAGGWGGHCVLVTGYDHETLWVYTWGFLQPMSWEFLHTYCDEAYVSLSHKWVAATGLSPSKLAWGKLSALLANL